MARLRRIAPCVAITNSDRAHDVQVQEQLGAMDGWICAEEVSVYKPDARFWHEVARRRGVAWRSGRAGGTSRRTGDYDLRTAKELGLTCVLVRRPHSRAGSCDLEVRDLAELASRLEAPEG